VIDDNLYALLGMLPVKPGTTPVWSSYPKTSVKNTDRIELEPLEPLRKITLTRPFELGRFPVTNLLWSLVTREPLIDEPLLPKTMVSWEDSIMFCQSLNRQLNKKQPFRKRGARILDKFDVHGFRLPTESEWLYALAANSQNPIYGPMDEISWNEENSGGRPQPVGLKLPNAWGFHDMLGNVWEHCWDFYQTGLSCGIDPVGPEYGKERTLRGGSCNYSIVKTNPYQHALRSYNLPSERFDVFGFRLARTIPLT